MATTRVRLSWDDFLARCPENRVAEWVDGEVRELLPPVARHQAVALFLAQLLQLVADFTRCGEVMLAPFLMRLGSEGPAREPDILFVRAEHADRLRRTHVEGPADLAVEVVSPDSVARDRAEKFDEYQRAGVAEYWVVDVRPGFERADFWLLDAHGRYRSVAPDADGAVRSTVLRGFWLRPEWLLAVPPPDVLLTFGEIVGFDAAIEALQRAKNRQGADGGERPQ